VTLLQPATQGLGFFTTQRIATLLVFGVCLHHVPFSFLSFAALISYGPLPRCGTRLTVHPARGNAVPAGLTAQAECWKQLRRSCKSSVPPPSTSQIPLIRCTLIERLLCSCRLPLPCSTLLSDLLSIVPSRSLECSSSMASSVPALPPSSAPLGASAQASALSAPAATAPMRPTRYCAGCGADEVSLRATLGRCSGCTNPRALYCNKKCQTKDWVSHQQVKDNKRRHELMRSRSAQRGMLTALFCVSQLRAVVSRFLCSCPVRC